MKDKKKNTSSPHTPPSKTFDLWAQELMVGE